METETPSVVPVIHLANDVIAGIAALAALEVPGVAELGSRLVEGLGEWLGQASDHRGVRVEVNQRRVSLALNLVVQYGTRIPDVAAKVQERVKSQVEYMTGLVVVQVDIHIQGVTVASLGDTAGKSGEPAR